MQLTDLGFDLNQNESIPVSSWPDQIDIPFDSKSGWSGQVSYSKFWDQCKLLRQYSDSGSDNFKSEYRGSTGWEYGFWVFGARENIVCSDIITTRSFENVKLEFPKINVSTTSDRELSTVTDTIEVDGKWAADLKYSGEDEIGGREAEIKA